MFDAPHRVEPGSQIPLLLLVKDAHLYPSDLVRADLTVHHRGSVIHRETLVHDRIRLSDDWWWTLFNVDVGPAVGWLDLAVAFTLEHAGVARKYSANNYRTANGRPLRVYRSADPLPAFPGFITGEVHAHSSYTSDQVEYGTPLRPARYMSRSMGLGFFGITDHSYDLDDDPTSYLVNDPQLRKWRAYQDEVDDLNADGAWPVVLRGEEVTVRNDAGRNVHCLVYGDRTFHPGAGDSAEEWLRTTSELSIPELLDQVAEGAGVFGAHIAEPVPLLQRLLLGRGAWSASDIAHDRLDGVQFWNGARDAAMARGKAMWVGQLLSGKRIAAVAGNDAHGNFNRFLQLKIPFVMLHDLERQLFGRVRTSVYVQETGEQKVLDAVRSGRSVMTDGPICSLSSPDGSVLVGSSIAEGDRCIVRARSSAEFGSLSIIRLLRGRRGTDAEETIQTWRPDEMDFIGPPVPQDGDTLYLRAEAETQDGDAYGSSHLAITNPVWGPAAG